MDSSIRSISRQFELRLAELDLLQGKLSKQLAQKYPGKAEPFSLLARLRKISKQLPDLYEETQDIDAKKEDLITRMGTMTKKNSQSINQLQQRCCLVETSPAVEVQVCPQQVTEDKENDPAAVTVTNEAPHFGVSETEFANVSKTIRGRTPLKEVNKLFEIVFKHFESNPQSPPLVLPSLAKMGAKVAGLKGTNSINTLRHLKLIKVSKAGITLFNMPKPKKTRKRRCSKKKV